MGLIDDIKRDVKKSGSNKKKFTYFKSGNKVRVRFLQDMDDGMKVLFHDSYQLGVNHPCQELFGRDCENCDNDDLRHRDQYLWCVWNYDTKEVEIVMGAVNQFTPIPALVGMYEAYGTLTDRDYVITKSGEGTSASFSVVPMDKVKFKNKEAKPFSESKILKLLDKAFPVTEGEDDEEEDEKPHKSKNKKDKSGKTSRKSREEDDDEGDNEEESPDYEDMSAKELYKLCQKRDIEAKPKKDEDYYIEKLEEWDEENSGSKEDEDDDW